MIYYFLLLSFYTIAACNVLINHLNLLQSYEQ
jgi:hypothetical protein